MTDKKRMLVTGGLGFIGSNFVNKFSDMYDIFIMDNLTYAANMDNVDWTVIPREKLLVKNIVNFEDVNDVFKMVSPEIVVNFAAESHVDNSVSSPEIFTHTNVVGTQRLMQKSLQTGVQKFVQVSTDEVYGHLKIDDPPFTEKTPLNPRSPYSATKASADMLARSYYNTYGLNVCITRCSNNFGKNQHKEKLIPKIIHNAMRGIPVPIYGDGSNIRDWIHVDDHISGINAVIERGAPGEVYNFGGLNSEKTNLELCGIILEYMNVPSTTIQFVIDRPGHDFRYSIDYTKANQELGWQPTVDFDNGLRETIDHYIMRFGKKS